MTSADTQEVTIPGQKGQERCDETWAEGSRET